MLKDIRAGELVKKAGAATAAELVKTAAKHKAVDKAFQKGMDKTAEKAMEPIAESSPHLIARIPHP